MEGACPAALDPEVAARVREVALAAFRVMECRDYARVDMRVDAQGQPWILEVNPNPDLAEGGAFETCARATGRTYSETLSAIVELALARQSSDAEQAREDTGEFPSSDEMLRRHLPRDAA
jgi:D-alanine-D-alanine ligase